MVLSLENQQRPLIIKLLFHPMLYASLLLHGLIFAIPGTPETEIPPELEEEEQEVQITMLDPIIEQEPTIELEELEPETVLEPEPLPQATQPPKPEPVAPPEQQAPPIEPLPLEEELPVYDPSGDRQTIVSSLEHVEGFFPAKMEHLGTFLPSDMNDLFFQAEDVLHEEIRGFAVLNDIKLSGGGGVATTFDPAEHIPIQDGMRISQLIGQTYGEGPVYEITTADGEPVFYANAVPSSSGGSSTVLFLWEYNPNEPPSNETNASDS